MPTNLDLKDSSIPTLTNGPAMLVRNFISLQLWPSTYFIYLVMAFSAGPRACMGERFAIIESVCTLANVVRKYKVSVPDELKSKSRKEQMKHLLAWVPRMTLIPSNAFVNVTRRY